jgi:hypothetical protein
MRENITQEIRANAMDDFRFKYGIDTSSAEILFREGSALTSMLQHMYLGAMEELRECDLAHDGPRIQGQAQTLWTLLNIPTELEEIKNLP